MRFPLLALLGTLGCAGGPGPPAPAPIPPEQRASQEERLAEKAGLFHADIRDHHLPTEGILLYQVDLDVISEQLREGTYPVRADTPTYTGLFAATSCTRARVTSGSARAAALADADRALSGLEFLTGVTGRPGLLARGIQRGPPPEVRDPDHRWFTGAAGYEDYAWRGDASHDQYANGLLPAIAECRLDFPERTRALIRGVAELLSSTGMRIVDPDGRPTLYGDLSPRSGFGFNAVGKLAGYASFALAAELDGDPRWIARRDELRDRDRVVASSTITNLRILGITNFSNDMMAWNLYRVLVPLARRTADPCLADLLRGMHKAWRRVRRDHNPYFTVILCDIAPDECSQALIDDARGELLRFPLDKRRLGPSPELARLPIALIPGRKGRRHARDLVPIELRPPDTFEWKSSPYRIWGARQPNVEYTGSDYLAAYWLYRRVLAGGQALGR